jgi:hypothetical protein
MIRNMWTESPEHIPCTRLYPDYLMARFGKKACAVCGGMIRDINDERQF